MTTVIVGERHTGKTTELVEWMIKGRPLPRYPMWSRVILVMDAAREQAVGDMLTEMLPAAWNDRLEREMAEQLDGGNDDVEPHALQPQRTALIAMRRAVRVFDVSPRLRGLDPDIEVAVDDADSMLAYLLGLTGPAAVLTLNGTARTLMGAVR